MSDTKNYLRKASDDAGETVRNFADRILEQLLDKGEASDDLLNDYPNGDSWHHESHVDKWYGLQDACEVISQLADYEETDSGLWQGQAMKEALGTCAAFTYGNAVYHEWTEKIKTINDEASTIIADFDVSIGDLEDEIADLHGEDPDLAAADALEQIQGKQADLDNLKDDKRQALVKLIEDTADTP